MTEPQATPPVDERDDNDPSPSGDATDTDHPTGQQQADNNAENESPS